MHPFFTISSSDIRKLNDEQARELVAQLCKAELSRKSISSSAVLWGGDQRAKDGGIDVSVDVKIPANFVDYIPRASTGFQVKAEPFIPSKIPDEMAPKGVLREAIKELINQSGAYIIVSTRDSCSPPALKSRIDAMAKLVAIEPESAQLKLDFYDCRRLADWASNYHGIAVWIKDCVGGALQGWKPYGPWAYRENDVASEYLLDNKIKVRTPKNDSGLDVIGAINNLRMNLSAPKSSARIVGLSGVGKTRLVQALFDDRISTAKEVLASDNVVYTDLADSPTPTPNALIEALIIANSDCVVVIDNCGQDVHQKLTDLIKRQDSKLKLITLEYDIRDHQPEGTDCYHLEGSSNEVISQLLDRHFSELSDLDIRKIVDFSDGNARVAFALASTSEGKGQLANLRDEDLFKRLFVQKQAENDVLERCAEAASLLYSFDVENLDPNSELSNLAALAEVSNLILYRHVSELQARGLIQARGQWRAVLPHAIANRLAMHALQNIPTPVLINGFIKAATERVARSFSRRLGYLHESTIAQKIVSNLLEAGGYLHDVSNLDTMQWGIFENLAPVNQRAALDAILQVVETKKHGDMNNFVSAAKLLRSLAYEEELFSRAVQGLLEFSLVESSADHYDKPIELLKALFYANLSGTLASPLQRAGFIRDLIFHPNLKYNEIGLELLEAALDTNYPSTTFSYEFGALKRTYGLSINTKAEIRDWFSQFIGIAIDVGKTDSQIGSKARKILGAALRGLWVHAQMEQELIIAGTVFCETSEWIRGWLGLKSVLQYDSKVMSEDSLVKLKSLEKIIAPKDIKSRIHAKVLSQGAYSIDLEDFEDIRPVDRYTRSFEEAIELGKIVALDTTLVIDLEPFIKWENASNKLTAFGIGIGEHANDVEMYLDRVKRFFELPLQYSVDFQFIGGLIQGWHKVQPEMVESFLDAAIEDKVWGPWFLHLQLSLSGGINELGYQRIMQALDYDVVEVKRYSNLGNGRALDNLNVNQIASLLRKLAAKSEGVDPSIDVLYMVIFAATTNPPKSEQYKSELRGACYEFLCKIDWSSLDLSDDNLLSHLESVIEFGLEGVTSDKHATALVSLLKGEVDKQFPKRIGILLVPFLKRSPKLSLDIIFEIKDKTKLYRILTLSLIRNEQFAIYAVPESSLIEWCKESPAERFLFAATTCLLWDKDMPLEEFAEEKGITNVAIQIFNHAPNKLEILKIFVSRFIPYSWSGSRSAIMFNRMIQMDKLNPQKEPTIQKIIESEKIRFTEIIDKEILNERDRDRDQLESFE